MSRRLPPSSASRLVDALAESHPAAGWDSLPPDATSDGEAVRWACARAMRASVSGARPSSGEFVSDGLRGAYLLPCDATMVARWRSCRHVYRFDADLADALGATDPASATPVGVLRALPYPIVCIEAPGLLAPLRGGPVPSHGVLAWLDRDPEDGHEVIALCWALQGGGTERAWAWVPLGAESVSDAAARVVSEDAEAGWGEGAGADVLAGCVGQAMALLLYVCAENADVRVAYAPPAGGRGRRPGRRTCPDTIHEVGAQVGRALGESRRAHVASRGDATGRTVAPHVRAAHWQHYWVGPRKGRTDGRHGDRLVLRWVAPTLVGTGDVTETVHEAGPHGQGRTL